MMRLFDSSILYWNNQQDAYNKAECYREGRLIKQSLPRALKLYQEAAQAGDARAMFRLGEHYQQNNQKSRAFLAFYEAGVRNNQSAINQLQSLSTSDAEAAFLLGKLYEVKKQYTQAISFYKKAHELKHPDGMYHVTKLFIYINTSEKQGKEVADYYRDAVKAGSKHALAELIELSKTSGKAAFYVAQLYERDLKQMDHAISYYEKASQLHFGEATYTLGNIYAQGKMSVAVDVARASRYYLMASQQGYSSAISSLQSLAQQGHAEAQYSLGYEYYRAKNDITNAVAWCVKADIQGHRGVASYLNGSFTREIYWAIAEYYSVDNQNNVHNITKAMAFARKASELGLKEATYSLAKVYFLGKNHVEKDESKSFFYLALAARQEHDLALRRLQQAAEKGHVEAQYRLGYDYYRNIQNIEQAVFWCVKAEIQDHVEAKKYLDSTFSKEICWKISLCYASEKSSHARNQQKALEYAIKASDLGIVDASEYLANSYYQGRDGVPVDRIKSYRYFIVAIKQGKNALLKTLESYADTGDKDAQYALYEYYRDTKKEELSLPWLVRAGLSRHTDAQQKLKEAFSADQHWRIADCYLENGVTPEDQRWIFHCQKAADKGHAQAAFYLAQQSEGINAHRRRSSLVTRYSTASNSHNIEAQSATQRFSDELIYTRQNSNTVFVSLNRAGISAKPISSVQQKMKRK